MTSFLRLLAVLSAGRLVDAIALAELAQASPSDHVPDRTPGPVKACSRSHGVPAVRTWVESGQPPVPSPLAVDPDEIPDHGGGAAIVSVPRVVGGRLHPDICATPADRKGRVSPAGTRVALR